jgi:hypothetical protein
VKNNEKREMKEEEEEKEENKKKTTWAGFPISSSSSFLSVDKHGRGGFVFSQWRSQLSNSHKLHTFSPSKREKKIRHKTTTIIVIRMVAQPWMVFFVSSTLFYLHTSASKMSGMSSHLSNIWFVISTVS